MECWAAEKRITTKHITIRTFPYSYRVGADDEGSVDFILRCLTSPVATRWSVLLYLGAEKRIMHLRNFACFCLSGGLLSTWFQESLPKNALYKSKTIQQIWKRLTSYFQMYNNPGEHSHTTYHRLTQNLSMEAGRMHCFFGLRFAKYNFNDFTGHQ